MVILKQIINTFLCPRFLFNLLVNNRVYDKITGSKKTRFDWSKIIYFYPTIIDAKSWYFGDKGEYRDPAGFVELRDGIDNYFLDYLSKNINLEESILDLGCNSGRHLHAIHELGYENLNGVDVMSSSLANFKKLFAATYSITKIKQDFFQRFLSETRLNSYDCVYTIGATIELVHPSYDIVKEMCRVSSKNILLVIQPERHNYPRFYKYEFSRNGFKLQHEKKLSDSHYFYHFTKE